MLSFIEYIRRNLVEDQLNELMSKGQLRRVTKADILKKYAERGKDLRQGKPSNQKQPKQTNNLSNSQRHKIKLKDIQNGRPHLDSSEIQILNSYVKLKSDKRSNPYIDTPFQTFRSLKSRACGAQFERLTKDYITKRFPYVNFLDKETPREGHKKSECDLVIDGKYGPVRIEVKGSSAWVNPKTGNLTHYKWQTIRLWQDYDIMIFLGMDPQGVNWWYTTKEELINAHLETQHGGKGAGSLKTTKHFDAPYKNPAEKFPFMHVLDEKGMKKILNYRG